MAEIHLPTLYTDETLYYQTAIHRLSEPSLAQVPPEDDRPRDTKTISSLDVKKKDKPLSCNKEEDIFIQYTTVEEEPGHVDVIYLVNAR